MYIEVVSGSMNKWELGKIEIHKYYQTKRIDNQFFLTHKNKATKRGSRKKAAHKLKKLCTHLFKFESLKCRRGQQAKEKATIVVR